MQIPESSWERSIDVSEFNNGGHPINWDAVVPILRACNPPVERVIVRASYGPNYEDPAFRHNWQALKRLNVPKGAYHAAVPGQMPNLEAQAQQQSAFFLGVVNHVGGFQGDDWSILDLEQIGGLSPDKLTVWALHWLSCVDSAVKNPRSPSVFYSYPAFIKAYMSFYDTLSCRPLWLADYVGGTSLPQSSPPNVGDWTRYYGWQYTDAMSIKHIEGGVDGSVFAVARSD